jgi:hypothetical protein
MMLWAYLDPSAFLVPFHSPFSPFPIKFPFSTSPCLIVHQSGGGTKVVVVTWLQDIWFGIRS